MHGIVSANRDLTHTLSSTRNRNVMPALKSMANYNSEPYNSMTDTLILSA